MNKNEFIDDLLNKMTLKEKIGQLHLEPGWKIDDNGVPDSPERIERIKNGEIGTIIVEATDKKEIVYSMQKLSVEESRLHIPLLINSDMIHGLETVFPIPLALASSFDDKMVEECYKMSAIEARAVGIHYTNAPMVDVSRDPRWGRIAESEGEDPYLAGRMAKAMVKGLQNDESYVIATLKHYLGYGAPAGGRDYNIVELNENTILNENLIPFREGINAGAKSIMTSFNSLDNVPLSANKKYLKDVLRDMLGFKGIVISDAGTVRELIPYGYAKDELDACVKSFNAGTDIDLGGYIYIDKLEEAINKGLVKEKELNERVRNILSIKYDLGLFDNPYNKVEDIRKVFSKEHLDIAYKMALLCPVLLENDGILPLKKKTKVSLVGKFSDSRDTLGCWNYSSYQYNVSTLLDGIEKNFTVDGIKNDYSLDNIDEITKNTDIVIFSFGEESEENGEARSHYNLHLPDEVIKCFNYLKSKGKKIISIMYGGRPLILNELKESNALIIGWHLGHMMGKALSDLIVGKVNFSAKLPVTFIKDEGQIPLYYAQKKLGRPYNKNNKEYRFQAKYSDGSCEPLYEFSSGINYSKCEYLNVKLNKTTFKDNETIELSLDILNNSDYDSNEIVMLFINDKISECLRPEKELKDYKKVFVKAHELEHVTFILDNKMFEYYHLNKEKYADPGEFDIMVGPNLNNLTINTVIKEE